MVCRILLLMSLLGAPIGVVDLGGVTMNYVQKSVYKA